MTEKCIFTEISLSMLHSEGRKLIWNLVIFLWDFSNLCRILNPILLWSQYCSVREAKKKFVVVLVKAEFNS